LKILGFVEGSFFVLPLKIQVREGGRKHKSEQEFCFLLGQGTYLTPPALAKQEVRLNHDLHPCGCGGLFMLSVL